MNRMAKDRTLVTLDKFNKDRIETIRKLYSKKERQPPSFTQLANKAIGKAIHLVHDEALAELK